MLCRETLKYSVYQGIYIDFLRRNKPYKDLVHAVRIVVHLGLISNLNISLTDEESSGQVGFRSHSHSTFSENSKGTFGTLSHFVLRVEQQFSGVLGDLYADGKNSLFSRRMFERIP